MPPGVAHEVLTTEASVTVGGHVLIPALVLDTVATALRLGRYQRTDSPPINASHNSAARCMIDRYALSLLVPMRRVLTGVQDNDRVEANPSEQLYIVWFANNNICLNIVVAVLLGEIAFEPERDSPRDRIQFEPEQHAAVLNWVKLFLKMCKLARMVTVPPCIDSSVERIANMVQPPGDEYDDMLRLFKDICSSE